MDDKKLSDNDRKVLEYCLTEDNSKAIAEDLGIMPDESTKIIADARKRLGLKEE